MCNFNLNPSKEHLKVHKFWASPCVIECQRIFNFMMHFNILIPSCPMTSGPPNKMYSVHPSMKKDHQS